MNEIIQIVPQKIGDQDQNVVSARQLYEALYVKKDFTDWIKAQIKRGRFKENIDFIVVWSDPLKGVAFLSETEVKNRTPQSLTASGFKSDYLITIETAKHVSLMSETLFGYEIRNYFIRVEQEYLELLKSGSQSDCWKDIRNEGKSPRRAVTDSIDRLVKNAFANGSKNANNYYRLITLETYRGLALINTNKDFSLATVDLKSYRDNLSKDNLRHLAVIESAISKLIDHELEVGTFYKTIFQKIKAKIDQFENFLLS